jgi:hypothetical protein
MADFTIEKGLVDGQTVAEWTQNWWTWALQAPADHNPLIDKMGSFAGTDNFGPVFFIGGTFATGQNQGVAERTFDVPAGKPLLIPVLNQFDTLDPKNVENKVMSDFKNQSRGYLTRSMASL